MNKSILYLWNVHFDDDEFSYTFINLDQAIESIRSFSDIHINIYDKKDDDEKNELIEHILSNVKSKFISEPSDCSVMIAIRDARINIRRVTLDEHHLISRIIKSSYFQVDSKTKKMIDDLYMFS
jgi:hypothetical protein